MSIKDNNLEQVTRAYVAMRRESTRAGMKPLYLKYYDKLCDTLQDTFWAPYSGRRSLQDQEKLWLKGRSPESLAKGERRVTNAKAGDSAHNWGCATDWAEFRPEYVKSQIWDKAEWEVFGTAVRSVGLIWGGDFKSINDKPHAELPIKVSWGEIGKVYREMGLGEALDAIKRYAIEI